MPAHTEEFAAQTIRLPKELSDKLKSVADTEHRSFNKQVHLFIESGLRTWESQQNVAA